ncbi:MAG: rhomboid family intramembrane serine protease [Planctomycetes bacterium]|nr:rhomboid family intramembrane serine protease [Planctomycetota bacterium]
MFHCPNCRLPLARHRTDAGSFWSCSACDGRVATVDFLRRSADHDAVNALWNAARSPLETSRRVCPSCERAMAIVIVETATWTVPIDACTTCQCLWFDRGEIERLGKRATRVARGLSPRASEAVARAEVAGLAADAAANPAAEVETWQSVLAALGFPVLLDRSGSGARPWIVIGFATTALFVGVAALTSAGELVTALGFPNGRSFAAWCGSFVGSVWVPASWWSLALTLYFSVVFGGEVELALGRIRFVVFALLAVAAGHVGFVAGDPPSDWVHVGAGSFVSACVAFFALLFPHARVHVCITGPRWSYARFLSLPASSWLVVWIVALFVQAFWSAKRIDATTSLAGSLLGFVVGVLARWIGQPRGSAPKLRIGSH